MSTAGSEVEEKGPVTCRSLIASASSSGGFGEWAMRSPDGHPFVQGVRAYRPQECDGGGRSAPVMLSWQPRTDTPRRVTEWRPPKPPAAPRPARRPSRPTRQPGHR
jgi:hypothetical protein